jgi:YD repeat-containing protein
MSIFKPLKIKVLSPILRKSVESQYDELNRLIQEKTTIGGLLYKYDSLGKPVEIQDPLGNKVENHYDVFGRLVEHRRSLHRHQPGDVRAPVTTSYTYDLDDQRITQTDALGRTTCFQYDGAGRLVGTILPDGSSDSWSYDRVGNLIEYRDRNGLIRRLDWDELNRNIALWIDTSGLGSGAEFVGAMTYRGEYDALNRFKLVENDFVINHFTYNSLDQPLQEIISFTATIGIDPANRFSIQREYANSGALIGLTYPSGREIRYVRDILDRVVKIVQVRKGDNYPGDPALPDNLTLADIDYEGMQIGRISRHNGISTRFRYDFSGRTVEIGHAKGSNNVLTVQFLYDALGNMRRRIEASEDHHSTEAFRYDSLSRLFEANKSGTATLLDLSSISPPSAPLPDDLPNHQAQIDQLISTPNAGQVAIYNYDLVGNRVSKVLGGVQSYETNELDQYVKVGNTPELFSLTISI